MKTVRTPVHPIVQASILSFKISGMQELQENRTLRENVQTTKMSTLHLKNNIRGRKRYLGLQQDSGNQPNPHFGNSIQNIG